MTKEETLKESQHIQDQIDVNIEELQRQIESAFTLVNYTVALQNKLKSLTK